MSVYTMYSTVKWQESSCRASAVAGSVLPDCRAASKAYTSVQLLLLLSVCVVSIVWWWDELLSLDGRWEVLKGG
jgi:hypothetical protein